MRFEPPRPKNDEERVLPLINVVFLLLIFFMLAGKLAATDPFQVEPPRSASEGPPSPHELRVLVGAGGEFALDGEVMAAEQLKRTVAERLGGEAPPKLRVKADARAEATRVVEVMEWLREAGAQRVQLLTVPVGR